MRSQHGSVELESQLRGKLSLVGLRWTLFWLARSTVHFSAFYEMN